jgi:uncharacterized protein YjiS (DUF1127 family)
MEAKMTTFETVSKDTSKGWPIFGVVAIIAATIVTRLRVWQNRRSVARLLKWDTHMLGDIGLTQGDVYAAMSTRLDEDASTQLAMLSMERRFAGRAQARDRLNHAAELRVAPATYRSKA